MAEQTRTYLIDKFQDGDIPTGQDFADMIDSSLNYMDDGLTSYIITDINGTHKRFGIGDTAPECPLGIKAEVGGDEELISFTSSDGTHKWNLNLNPTVSNIPGFSIDDKSTGTSTSRFFIDGGTNGNIGIGTVTPLERVHIVGTADGDLVSEQIQNLSTGHNGWTLSHIDDNAILERVGAFGIVEIDTTPTGPAKVERMTFLKKLGAAPNYFNNVGINEKLPFATLHVTRIDVNEDVRLAEDTGILLLGPIDSTNLAMDSHEIQARTGSYIGTTLSFVASELDLQPLGGAITIHSSYTPDKQIIITDDGLMGLGKTPIERLDVNGAVTFGDTNTAIPAEGTVRWHVPTGSPGDLQVWKAGAWQSLTTLTITDGFWNASAVAGSIYFEPVTANAKVGIGTVQPNSALHVVENNQGFQTNCAAANIINSANTETSDVTLLRAGIHVVNSGPWNVVHRDALNIGLYVSSVDGQNANANLGAVINGSVVIGGVTGLPLVGSNGTNVLAIQNGVAPIAATGAPANGGIQIFSGLLTNPDGTTASIFNMMNGDGSVIQLYEQPALPAENHNDPNTGDINTNILIKNMRDRIDALELALQTLGLLA